jgi:hypothetical protein
MDSKFQIKPSLNTFEENLQLSPISQLVKNYRKCPLEEIKNLRISDPIQEFEDLPTFTPCFGGFKAMSRMK